MARRNPSNRDDWAAAAASGAVWVVLLVAGLGVVLLWKGCALVGRAFERDPCNPALWVPLIGLVVGGLLALLGFGVDPSGVVGVVFAVVAASSALTLLIAAALAGTRADRRELTLGEILHDRRRNPS
jgi:hypothetical protein